MNRMQHKSWPALCESLLDRLEAKGEDTITERAEFGVFVADCCANGCDSGLKGKEPFRDVKTDS